ncbi:hypothetical protein DSL72_008466 [Monilinia vaccinii-corymbosi]|uniref:Major facilitator superfamily (MFS) profile domain-containing protein n=1 Tax=Monilinia vaccinii-corymbosi TaxID=61207 RepID=A0A8A3PL37_9HELO|nr:hypothetical protein DSL72_008466 [Monilinia vaccinii-corymbosi]
MTTYLAEDTDTGVSYLKAWKLSLVTFSLSVGTFLVALDVNIIGVAISKITSVFHSLGDASWYILAYLLTVTALQPTIGRYLYKSFIIRLIYFSSVIVFEVGSVLCAAAPSSGVFIFGRAVAGTGAAGLLQGALAIITHIVELERRPLFMGIVVSVFGLSICSGPVMGGVFVDSVGWRWCFWIVQSVPDQYTSLSLRRKFANMDLIGTVTFLGAICCLTLALQWGGQTKLWRSSQIVGLFLCSSFPINLAGKLSFLMTFMFYASPNTPRIVAIPIAHSQFLSKFGTEVTNLLPSLNPEIVIAAGAAGLDDIAAGSMDALVLLRTAYTSALKSPFILALSAACVGAVCLPALEWKNIKTEAAKRKDDANIEPLREGQNDWEKAAEIRTDAKEFLSQENPEKCYKDLVSTE